MAESAMDDYASPAVSKTANGCHRKPSQCFSLSSTSRIPSEWKFSDHSGGATRLPTISFIVQSLLGGNNERSPGRCGRGSSDRRKKKIARLQFADDIALLSNTEEVQDLTTRLDRISKRFGMIIFAEKTKSMQFCRTKDQAQVKIEIHGKHWGMMFGEPIVFPNHWENTKSQRSERSG